LSAADFEGDAAAHCDLAGGGPDLDTRIQKPAIGKSQRAAPTVKVEPSSNRTAGAAKIAWRNGIGGTFE
jgi:hypothetical protein